MRLDPLVLAASAQARPGIAVERDAVKMAPLNANQTSLTRTCMPTYEYRCADCSEGFEIVQKFSDPALTTCPECEGDLRKVFSAVGVVFKGSGFYATDNRTKGSAAAAAAKSDAPASAGSGESTSAPAKAEKAATSEPKADTKPKAAATPAA